MEGNAGLKTAIPSNVFVTVHSSTYPLPATNIILLQQASRVEGGKKRHEEFTVWGDSFDVNETLKQDQIPAVREKK